MDDSLQRDARPIGSPPGRKDRRATCIFPTVEHDAENDMPKRAVTASQLWSREITFVSIDTDLIQAAGYHFSSGALHQLPRQLPRSMSLRLTEIVAREIVSHRMQSVAKAIDAMQSASATLRRLLGDDILPANQGDDQRISESARARFRAEIEAYASQCRGSVIPVAGADAATDLFKAYFDNSPPFGTRNDKKHEFPDAMSLWLLETFAAENGTQGLIASKDGGWEDYAAESDRLYYVDSIEALAHLFVATDDLAKAVRQKVEEAVTNASSGLRTRLDEALGEHVERAEWDAGDVYSGNVPRIEATAGYAWIAGSSITGKPHIWSTEDDPTTWVVELNMSVDVRVAVDVEFFVWDSIDREELSMGSQDYERKESIEVEIYLSCSGVSPETSADDWDIEIDIAEGSYAVKAFEAELDFGGDD